MESLIFLVKKIKLTNSKNKHKIPPFFKPHNHPLEDDTLPCLNPIIKYIIHKASIFKVQIKLKETLVK